MSVSFRTLQSSLRLTARNAVSRSSMQPIASATTQYALVSSLDLPRSARSFHSSVFAHEDNKGDGRQQDVVMDEKADKGHGFDNDQEDFGGLDPTVGGLKDYSPEVQELAERIVKLNLIEIGDLCDLLKDKMGLDQAEFFMPMGGGGGAPVAAAEEEEEAAPKEEKTHFDIKLTNYDAKAKIKVIKEVRGLAGLGLKEAKEVVESVPAVLMKDIKKEEANAIIEKLKDLGAEAELE